MAAAIASTSAVVDGNTDVTDERIDYGDGDGDNLDMTEDDKELEAMKARVKEMEKEAAKLREMQAQMTASAATGADGAGTSPAPGTPGSTGSHPVLGEDEKAEIDARSIHVGNVDFSATPEEIQQHFASCGTINRVTILVDKFTGHPKGYAYVEFADPSLVANSMTMNESLFKGRLIKVQPKRTNLPHFMLPGARGRGGRAGYRGGRGAGRGYSPYGGRPPRGAYRGRGRG